MTKLAIGPANYAGQAHRWTQAVSSALGVEALSFCGAPLRGGGYGFDVNRRVQRFAFRAGALWSLRARKLLDGATHVALDGFQSFFRWDRHEAFTQDARRLERMGYRMGLIAHGTDVRDPAAHMERDPWSYFTCGDDDWRAHHSVQTRRNRAFAQESGWPVWYSTPDLGFDLPFGRWLPVVVDVDAWSSDQPVLEREKPRVLHIPRQRKPPIKGTHLIMPVLERLEREGAIEVLAPTGLPHRAVKELVRSCDVVVDQLMFGSYGVAAVESMAAGRITVGRMIDDVCDKMPQAPEMLEADPNTLYDVLASVRNRRDELRDLAERGRAFAHRWHNGEESARALSEFVSSSAD